MLCASLPNALTQQTHTQPSHATGSATSFWLFIFIMGFTLAIINNYTFLMLVDKLHADSNLLGVISLARITLEIPFFFWSGSAHDAIVRWVGRVVRIEGRFKQEDGMRWTLVIAMVVLVVRVGMYSAMSYFRWNAWVDVGVELLHGR